MFVLYGIDKLKAVKKCRRIRESTLTLSAFLFGGVGAIFGMVVFNHKTSKAKFRVAVPLSVLLNAAVIYIVMSNF